MIISHVVKKAYISSFNSKREPIRNIRKQMYKMYEATKNRSMILRNWECKCSKLIALTTQWYSIV